MRSITIIFLLTLTTAVFAGNGLGRSPYHHDPHPFRLYYFGYDITNPGFGLGPELNLSWTKMEKSKCSHGARVSDRQLLLAPQIGMFRNESNTLSLFGDLELDYRVTFHGGFTFEVFGAGGYAQVLESADPNADTESSVNKSQPVSNVEAKSGFMPQAGLGFGYNFQKLNGRNIPFALNFRTIATTVDVSDFSSIVPTLQAGFTYDF